MLKIVDVVTSLIALLPRAVTLLRHVADVAEKVADFLDGIGKPKV